MPLDAAKPLRESLRVAVLASGADFRAATNGVPGGVGPLDVRIERQYTGFGPDAAQAQPYSPACRSLFAYEPRIRLSASKV
jgi:hypothetical protein